MRKIHTEIRFEEAIEHHLIKHGGYSKGDPKNFDAESALFPEDVTSFLKATQGSVYDSLYKVLKADTDSTIISDLKKELAVKGVLHVLRNGFKCYGKKLRMAYFSPNTGMNPEAWTDYEKNVLTLTRQVHFSIKNRGLSLDVLLSLNGIPVVTMELKNAMTGQNIDNAINQYKTERDPEEPIFRFKERSLVHFAVDTSLVYMTTRLQGEDTFFLPFNQGNGFAAGNPPVDDAYRTGYLWESVLKRDSLLDILGRFMHLQEDVTKVPTKKGVITKRKETMIFPRYHQLDCVRKLIGHARQNGSGHNYLVQHSAGSGKSNSIAWLAHRLASLHNDADEKVFSSVVVITDRTVLDQQLQDTIYQFDHKAGVVEKIEEDTQQLAKALANGVPVIISTIQKFPFITQALQTLSRKGEGYEISTKDKRFAVIVDEAHSSQSGETAMELRKVLNKDGIESAIAEQLLDMEDDDLSEEAKRGILEEMTKRPKQPNLSFFAFTATPKFKTLATFDEPNDEGETPFHLYSMRQAIEEGFIMDVLENYTTYKAYFGVIKNVEDDPNVPKKKAARALARFASLHPHNIQQKVEVIIEHFRTHTKHKIGGRGKAMVVTGSRLHAVRYKQAFDKYIKEQRYTDIKSLVAFSGTVHDDEFDVDYTEVGMNQGIREKELPDRFASDEYQVLLVAEKYQTGFDQPLLHTMYVDKRLSGVQAVQTLSRLNRTASGKEDTFVLDFVNEPEDIYNSFKPYYEKTLTGEDIDPHNLYRLQHQLEEWRVFTQEEVNAFCDIFFRSRKEPTHTDHRNLDNIVKAGADRFALLDQEDQEECKSQMVSFRHLYAFLSQIIPFQDSELEKLYTYLRFLLLMLPKRQDGGQYELGDEVKLKYYRLQKISEGRIELQVGEEQAVYGPSSVGTRNAEDEEVLLSMLVDRLNDRFGTDFTPADQLFFDQVIASAVGKKNLQDAAKVNKYDNFKHLIEKMMEGLFIERIEGNEEVFTKLMNDERVRQVVVENVSREVYNRLSV